MIQDNKKKKLPAWINQKPGSVANVFDSLSSGRTSKQITDEDKKKRPKGDTFPNKPTQNVFKALEEKRTPNGVKSLFSGKATDRIPPDQLKVDKNNQKRVNKILGY